MFTIVWLENAIAGGGLKTWAYYFPGLGLLLALAVVYLIGLFVTTFVGRWLWRRTDRLLENVPLLGTFYQSLKEVLGYDSAKERFFQGVVAVQNDDGLELGLITGQTAGPNGDQLTLVFVPGSPNPTNGKLLLVEPQRLCRLDVKVAAALRALVSMGKTPLREA